MNTKFHIGDIVNDGPRLFLILDILVKDSYTIYELNNLYFDTTKTTFRFIVDRNCELYSNILREQ